MTEALATRARLSIKFTDYWVSSTGGSGEGDLDLVAYRDPDGFPAMPMTQIKGALRETATRIWGHNAGKIIDLFGGEGSHDQARIRFAGDARLDPDERKGFGGDKTRIESLFGQLRSTAIDGKGVAKTDTLRTLEVAVPLTLCATLEWVGACPPDPDWVAHVDQLCALTFALGHDTNGGRGRAILTCEAMKDAKTLIPDQVTGPARRITLDLAPEDAAVFSRSNANECAQTTHPAPTGASLWGWAIGKLYNDDTLSAVDRHTLFHSGKVRFSDAAPLIDDKTPAFPLPRNLFIPKTGAAPFISQGCVDPIDTRIGMAAYRKDHPENADTGEWQQPVAASAGPISLLLDAVARVTSGHRLRTAMKDGKAENSKLFGYAFVQPPPTGYRAVVEADDDVDQELWDMIAAAMQGRLFLGKARHSGYGGGFTSTVAAGNPGFTVILSATAATCIRIWCLSDLVLGDDWGNPVFEPRAQDFGLEAGWQLVPGECAVTSRRFAPWDRAIDRHSREITVIEAGSVFAFGRDTATDVTLKPVHGALQERGHGRVTLMSELPAKGRDVVDDAKAAILDPQGALAKWAEAGRESGDTKARDTLLTTWSKVIEHDLQAAVRNGPSRTQWSLVAQYAGSPNLAAMLKDKDKFKDKYGWAADGKVNGRLVTIKDWLSGAVDEINKSKLPAAHRHYCITQLVKAAKQIAPAHGKGDE